MYVYISHVLYYDHDSHPVPSPNVRSAAYDAANAEIYDKMTIGPENSQ